MDIFRWNHMSIAELNKELEELRKNMFLLGKENSFRWQFKTTVGNISHLGRIIVCGPEVIL